MGRRASEGIVCLSVVRPDGKTQLNTHTIKWQIGLSGHGDIYDLLPSIDSCGPKREWLMVQAKPSKPTGRSKHRR